MLNIPFFLACPSTLVLITCCFFQGFNGADLRNICTEAGMSAIRAERDYVIHEDFMKVKSSVVDRLVLKFPIYLWNWYMCDGVCIRMPCSVTHFFSICLCVSLPEVGDLGTRVHYIECFLPSKNGWLAGC